MGFSGQELKCAISNAVAEFSGSSGSDCQICIVAYMVGGPSSAVSGVIAAEGLCGIK